MVNVLFRDRGLTYKGIAKLMENAQGRIADGNTSDMVHNGRREAYTNAPYLVEGLGHEAQLIPVDAGWILEAMECRYEHVHAPPVEVHTLLSENDRLWVVVHISRKLSQAFRISATPEMPW